MEKLGERIKDSIDKIPVPKEKLDLAVNEAFTKTKIKRRQPKKSQVVLMGMASLFMIGLVSLLFSTILLQSEESASPPNPNKGAFETSEAEHDKGVIESEETSKEFYAKKELAEDFRFEVEEVRVTPSHVSFHTRIRLPKGEFAESQLTYGLTVMENKEAERFNHLPEIVDLKTYEDYTDISRTFTAYKSEVHLSRDLVTDQFMVIPYVFIDEEVIKSTNLQRGGTLLLDQNPIEIDNIKESDSHTTVSIQAEKAPVHFPFHMIAAYDETNDQGYKALSFNKLNDGLIEIVYPKIENTEETFLYMYNIMIFDELVVEVNLE